MLFVYYYDVILTCLWEKLNLCISTTAIDTTIIITTIIITTTTTTTTYQTTYIIRYTILSDTHTHTHKQKKEKKSEVCVKSE